MSRFAKEISLDNLDTPLVLHRKNNRKNDNDEISTLSAAINTMRYQLQTSLASLKSREHKYRSMLQTALNGFWNTDNHGEFLEVDDA